jgi:hypothetical protein
MTKRAFILAASMITIVAISGPADAGLTISDQRYWPSEVGRSSQSGERHHEDAFDSTMTTQTTKQGQSRYHGGPKYND